MLGCELRRARQEHVNHTFAQERLARPSYGKSWVKIQPAGGMEAVHNVTMLNGVAPSGGSEETHQESDREVEIVILAQARAIQQLIRERDVLLKRIAEQECELSDFRRQNNLIHDSYRLTTEFVRHFQLFESAIDNLITAAGAGRQQVADEGMPKFLRVAQGL
jgi:hypothetical protein